MPNIDFDEIVKRSVQKSFGHALDYFAIESEFGSSLSDLEGIVIVDQTQEVDDESGRRYFVWGVSTWGGSDVVKD
jgi:hypothetical protein